jgi:drug/metabolite transporter (DMT)-like permease
MQRPRLAASCCSKRRRCGGLAMVRSPSGSPAFCSTGIFFVALILYAALTVLWVWILSYTPLSRAYPFLALAFALTPALGCLVFAEPLRYGS